MYDFLALFRIYGIILEFIIIRFFLHKMADRYTSQDLHNDPTNKRVNNLLFELSTLLNCGLKREELETLVQLIELGVNPHALVEVVMQLRQEIGRLNEQLASNN